MNENENIEALRKKYDDLLDKHREVIGEKLSVEARQVVNTLDAAGNFTLPEAVADALKISRQRAIFLLERLAESGRVLPSGFTPRQYRILQKGRMAVHGTSAA